MLSLRRLVNFDFNSSFLRLILSLYYREGRCYRIPFGPLTGSKIWYDRSINYHAVIGVWERNNFLALKKVLPVLLEKQSVVCAYDIGANIGLYSLFFSRYSERIKVVAFEAVQDTVRKLKRNIDENRGLSIAVVDRAIGNIDGHVSFYLGHHHKSSLEKDWTSDRGATNVEEISVPCIRLDSFVATSPGTLPDIIKIDVEGGADKVLEGAGALITRKRPVILIESHTGREDAAIIRMLSLFDYKAFRVTDNKWVKHPRNDYLDRDGVWGTLLLFPSESASEYLKKGM